MDEALDVVLVQLAVSICVQFIELFSQEFLIFGDGSVEEAGNELSVVHLTASVEVHRREDLIDIVVAEVGVDFLSKVVQTDHHFVPRNHAVAVDVQFHEDFP